MSKAFQKFPTEAAAAWSVDRYGHDVRMPVGKTVYSGLYGLEFELEGGGFPLGVPDGWARHEDGSLRGGVEYVLTQPLDRAQAEQKTRELFDFLRGTRFNNSYRTSTHVHINLAGVKLNTLASFVALWGTFENVLANWCGEHRAGNLFALRMSDCDTAVAQWLQGFQTGYFDFPHDYRYLALNPSAISRFGSLEIRTMRGVSSAAEFEPWLDAIDTLLAKARAYGDPSEIVADFSAFGARGFLERTFGGFSAELIRKTEELGQDVDKLLLAGFRRVQPILFVLPWGQVLPEIAKVYVPNPFGSAKPKRKRATLEAEFAPVAIDWGEQRPARGARE